MDCKKADELMMKYMDGLIDKDEAKLLSEHVEVCAGCKEAFMIYDSMMDGFSELEIINAPDDFELHVMEKIKELPPISENIIKNTDNVVNFVWGALSVLLGIGTLITIYRDSILNYMLANESLAQYAKIIEPNINYFENMFATSIDGLYTTLVEFNAYIAGSKFFIMAILATLLVTQFFIYRKDKVEA